MIPSIVMAESQNEYNVVPFIKHCRFMKYGWINFLSKLPTDAANRQFVAIPKKLFMMQYQ